MAAQAATAQGLPGRAFRRDQAGGEDPLCSRDGPHGRACRAEGASRASRARVMAREEYAGLTEEERDWHDADLAAARAACHSHLDFAKLLPQVDRFLA